MSIAALRVPSRTAIPAAVLVGLAVLLALAAFGSALLELVNRWNKQEEYSHGYFIPLIVAWLLWRRREALAASIGRPSWTGVAVIGTAILLNVVGELSAIYILSQVGFVLSLLGLTLAFGGWSLLKVTFVPIAFLLFAIPLPYFIDSALSLRLQLFSTELAGVFIRFFGIAVYLDGNVIDLGDYKLQVVDACSGLRYLFPLTSLGFLAAYLFQAPFWQRAFIFLSTIPITILMNSFRIAVVAVLVNYWGPSMADGALHLFEGWIIFLACAGVLLAEMYLLARFVQRRRFFDIFYVPELKPAHPGAVVGAGAGLPRRLAPVLGSVALLAAGGVVGFQVANRTEIVPERARFVSFPNTIGEWRGRSSTLEPQVEHVLGLEDYVLVDYSKRDGKSVNFYVAYYASQRTGTSPHSPLVCIPGGGWQITSLDRTAYADGATTFPFNRVMIERGQNKQLVYYWFEQRGRRVANEWLSKWYLLADAISMNRTDGALVRLTTHVYPGETEGDADQRIRSFIPELSPALTAYLPTREPQRIKRALGGSFKQI